ncbi:MAG TPA: [FeFe] hydrogenase H-cluster maturation GTPase HydF [Bacteroidales bacterium]|nr:[FeFe] hydrogenase H-cluster maturation GTPase HydF [Bacteroidales bacterium]
MKGQDLKPHIGIFGRRNVGKSQFINSLTGSEVSIVSKIAGTTTDPVRKAMELQGIGPVILIDTAGIDDVGGLGEMRMIKTLEIIKQIDCAILLVSNNVYGNFEETLLIRFKENDLPYLIVHNKSDEEPLKLPMKWVEFSALTRKNLEGVLVALKNIIPDTAYQQPSLLKGIINRGEVVMLITPIDSEAPEGRMILPQVMAIRDVLDQDAVNIVVKESEAAEFLEKTGLKPALVLTDSQVFNFVSKIIPAEIPLSSFSIAFAHMRGPFEAYVQGTKHINELKDGDRVLMLESCTHQVSCEDIGRHKLPRWLAAFTHKSLEFEIVAGLTETKHPIGSYAMIIQCGGCMITRRQVLGRLSEAIKAGIPISNYGMTIAFLNGIFERAVAPFNKTV